jgi:hypothetical protein
MMKSITEVPEELASLKRRTIRSLATEDIEQKDCTYITTRLDEIASRIAEINNRKETAHGSERS